MLVSVSVATIPIRVENRTIYNFIDSMLNQTHEIDKIYINISSKYTRFRNLEDKEIDELKNYNEKIIISIVDRDSPIIKYTGSLDKIDDNTLLFIGDDDQEYHPKLIEKMVYGIFDYNCVYQNRYYIVKHGTAGIVHGFCGLMMKKGVLNNIKNYSIPYYLWCDDQFMSIYFHKEKVKIQPTLVHEFEEIYKDVNMYFKENVGAGGDLCLDKNTNDRNTDITTLEIKYDAHFLWKNKIGSTGEVINLTYKERLDIYDNLVFHCVCLDNFTDDRKRNFSNLKSLYPKAKFEYWNTTHFKKEFPSVKLHTTNLIKYYTDALGKYKVDELGGYYINCDFNITDRFNIIDYYLDSKTEFYDNDMLTVYKNLSVK